MKRGMIIGLVIGAALLVGVGTAVAVSVGGEGAATDTVAEATGPASEPKDSAPPSVATQDTDAGSSTDAVTSGAYVEYSETALAAAEGTPVLFFHAPWCPQCRALEADIEASGVPAGITVLKVDYDSNQELRQEYGVTLQTTVVALDDAGDATAVFVPYDDPTLTTALTGLGLTG